MYGNKNSITFFSWPRVQLYELFNIKTKKRDHKDLWAKWWHWPPGDIAISSWASYQYRGPHNVTY